MTRLFTEEQTEFIQQKVKGISNENLSKLVNEKFGLQITKWQMKTYKKNHNLSSGLSGYFEKGHIPANKGKHQKIAGDMRKTMFKKGHRPHNFDPVGTEKIKDDGYVWVKVANPRKWKQKHRIIYEELHGPIPEGIRIIFADRNKFNFNPDNLIQATRQQMLEMNRKRLIKENADLTKIGLNIAKLNVAVHEAKNKKQRM